VLSLANLNMLDLKMIFSIVKVTRIRRMAPIVPTRQQDVLISLISSIPMAHACQAALTQEGMNGMMDHISALLLVFMENTLML